MRLRSQLFTLRVAVIFAALVIWAVPALAARRERLIDTWRPKHFNVNITLNKQLTEISAAQVRIDIVAVKQLASVDLDFGDLVTDKVLVDDNEVTYVHQNGKLNVTLGKSVSPGTNLTVTVLYHGKPKDGLILTNNKDGTPSAVGDNWPDRVHHWIPCLDHPSAKATVSFIISAPSPYVAVANGRLTKVERNEIGGQTWTYTEAVPIPPYCMVIGVGEFSQREPGQSTSIPISYLVPYSDREYSIKGFGSAWPSVQFFSETVAPYPYEKLALIIGATRFGGMENSSAIVFTTSLFTPQLDAPMSKAFGIPTNIESVVAHEIAHQWFGDSVTESTWADLWLSEGFATYFAALFIEKHDGEEAFQQAMKAAAEKALTFEKKNRIPIHDRDTEDLFKLLNPNNYQKGSWVLHMLRSRLGDDAFFRGIKAYYRDHKDGTADTDDLRSALEQSSGQKLQSFFDRWVFNSGHPQYKVSWEWLPAQHDVKITVTQTQQSDAFLDPVPIAITTSSGTTTTLITPTGKSYVKTVQVKDRPTKIDFDPKNTLLKEVSVDER